MFVILWKWFFIIALATNWHVLQQNICNYNSLNIIELQVLNYFTYITHNSELVSTTTCLAIPCSVRRPEFVYQYERDRNPRAWREATFWTMKNEVRINVYVWADFSVSTSRVDVRGRGGVRGALARYRWSRAPPLPALRSPARPHAATRLIACTAQPLYILTGVLTPVPLSTLNSL